MTSLHNNFPTLELVDWHYELVHACRECLADVSCQQILLFWPVTGGGKKKTNLNKANKLNTDGYLSVSKQKFLTLVKIIRNSTLSHVMSTNWSIWSQNRISLFSTLHPAECCSYWQNNHKHIKVMLNYHT